MATGHARLRQYVTAVTCLDQRVGAEAQTSFGGDDLVDHGGIIPGIDVVDQLRALVAEEPGVLEARGSLHDARR